MEIAPQDLEAETINKVQFGVFSPDDVESMSVVEVTTSELMRDGIPISGGLLDLRMGTTMHGMKCLTCGMNDTICPGHFGHITLAAPVMHMSFLPIILRVLRSVCYDCSRPLFKPGHMEKASPDQRRVMRMPMGHSRLETIEDFSRGIHQCGGSSDELKRAMRDQDALLHHDNRGCNSFQPHYRRRGTEIEINFDQRNEKARAMGINTAGTTRASPVSMMSGEDIYKILDGISDVDAQFLGFDTRYVHPKWFMLRKLPVSPPCVRPSVNFGGRTSSDDLTAKLVDILRANLALSNAIKSNAPMHAQREMEKTLQMHIATMFDNTTPGVDTAKSSSGKRIKSISQRLKGKSGRIRQNLMGKRSNFTARTVITGDPNLGIDQLGVPRSVARTLTYPEVVTRYNKKRLQELVRNGPDVHPGARTVIRPDGKVHELAFTKGSIPLDEGYVVERHICDGDIVLFNRQPSLHKMSFMAHKIRVMPHSSFRLNLSCTTPYNADFDGDEMNMHVCQSPLTRAEAFEIMLSPRQIVSPQASKPVMGIVQDSLLGVSRFTRRDCFVPRTIAFNLLMWVDDWNGQVPIPAILKPRPLWTGKQLFSIIIPEVNVLANQDDGGIGSKPMGTPGFMNPNDSEVTVIEGQLVTGILNKKTIGNTPNSLIHIIWNEKGQDTARQFFTSTQKIVNNWLVTHGFTVGVQDTVAESDTLADVQEIIRVAKEKVDEVINKARKGQIKSQPGQTVTITFEKKVREILNDAINSSGKKVQAKLDADNSINAMVQAGSKGSHLNISQILACVGQQNVNSARVPFSFRGRTLPHFFKGDVGPEARGFVASSYLSGLTPQEFFFHAMGGREGVIDTACKTADTGYIQRRLVKSMEDVRVHYDATVRNSLGDIVQFVYGEDGMDGCYIEMQQIDSYNMDNNTLTNKYKLDITTEQQGHYGGYKGMGSTSGVGQHRNLLSELLDQETFDETTREPQLQAMLDQEFEMIKMGREELRKGIIRKGHDNVALPVNLKRLILNAQKKYAVHTHKRLDLSPLYIMNEVKALEKRLIVVVGDDELSREAQDNATLLFRILLRSTLATRRVLEDYRLTKVAFDFLIGEIESRFRQALVQPGEMVGAIAAQSIGEPATQMTLNTFHLAGVAANNMSTGVPRLREIINVAKNPKAFGHMIDLKPHVAKDEGLTKKVLSRLEYTVLRDIADRFELYYDPDPMSSVVEEDRDFVRQYYDFPADDDYGAEAGVPPGASPWLIRILLNRLKTEDKGLSNEDIARAIRAIAGNKLHVIYNGNNAATRILHVRLVLPTETQTGGNGVGGSETKTNGGLSDRKSSLEATQAVAHHIANHNLRGIKNINKVVLRNDKNSYFDEKTGAKMEENLWSLETEGCNMAEVMADLDVVHSTCYTNHIGELFTALGIEAARASVLREIRAVIEAGGSYISYRHAAMLVDVMTFRGYLMAISRHGFNKLSTGPLMRCSFEESVKQLVNAAAFGETDHVLGVSEPVMLGQLAKLGTGSFDLMLDAEKVKYALDAEPIIDYTFDTGSGGPNHDWAMMDTFSDVSTTEFSPVIDHSASYNFNFSATPSVSPASAVSPSVSPTSPAYVSSRRSGVSNYATSATFAPASPTTMSAASPAYRAGHDRTSPAYSPTSPAYSPTSPAYSPTSPAYSPTSPAYSPAGGRTATSPAYSPTSPAYSPTSPAYSPTSPAYSPTSPAYSPTSPAYSPSSTGGPVVSPTSPAYSPTSPAYSPTSPAYSPTSPAYSPTSPAYTPTSPANRISPTSPAYSPTSPAYSPTSPAYSPTSPAYSPTSPAYSPTSPAYSPADTQKKRSTQGFQE